MTSAVRSWYDNRRKKDNCSIDGQNTSTNTNTNRNTNTQTTLEAAVTTADEDNCSIAGQNTSTITNNC